MFTDYHVHTEFSDDSSYPMEEVIKDAINMKMDEICFTDHVDYGIKRDWNDAQGMLYRKGAPGEPEKMPLANVNYPKYFEKIEFLRNKPHFIDVVLTGRDPKDELVELSNYVTEMKCIKHPFKEGIPSRVGIEL